MRETSAFSRNWRFANASRSVSASSWLQRLPVMVLCTETCSASLNTSSSMSSPNLPRSHCEGPIATNSTRACGNCSEGLCENSSQPAKVGTTLFPSGRARSSRSVICSTQLSSMFAGRQRSVRSAYCRSRARSNGCSNFRSLVAREGSHIGGHAEHAVARGPADWRRTGSDHAGK